MISMENIQKRYGGRTIFDQFSLSIEDGKFIAIIGKSGSGKTTLFNIMGLIDRDFKGTITVDNQPVITSKQIRDIQRYQFSYLFQNYVLIEKETIRQNLSVALRFRQAANKDEIMRQTLEQVGLNLSLNTPVYELSGGEQQRVALARAMLKKPKYLFADEPTGNLDSASRDIVFDCLKDLNKNEVTIIMVTHDMHLADQADSIIEL